MTSSVTGTQNIPQIYSQVEQLRHVEVEYSSTLKSYQMTLHIMSLVKTFIDDEAQKRISETQLFSSDQGLGLRKIMLEHYQRISSTMGFEMQILNEVTASIYQKHKSMLNSLDFIQPILKEVQRKNDVLERQLNEIKQKIQKLDDKKMTLTSRSHIIENLSIQKNPSTFSEIFKKQSPSQSNVQPQKETMTLFSTRKFEKFDTEVEFDQMRTFLHLKLEEVEDFIKIERKSFQNTIQRIFEILDEILGKGLEKLEQFLFQCIQREIPEKFHTLSNTPNQIGNEADGKSKSESAVDLHCYESLEEVLKDTMGPKVIRGVKKRLYASTQIDGVDLTHSVKQDGEDQEPEKIQISPTFNCSYPLILQLNTEINQFDLQGDNGLTKSCFKQSTPYSHLYDSFSKENFNTMNNEQK